MSRNKCTGPCTKVGRDLMPSHTGTYTCWTNVTTLASAGVGVAARVYSTNTRMASVSQRAWFRGPGLARARSAPTMPSSTARLKRYISRWPVDRSAATWPGSS